MTTRRTADHFLDAFNNEVRVGDNIALARSNAGDRCTSLHRMHIDAIYLDDAKGRPYGGTRIRATAIDEDNNPIARSAYYDPWLVAVKIPTRSTS